MEKVKVSKELAMAIEKGMEVSKKEDFLKSHSQPGEWTLDVYFPLNKLSIFELAEILIKGYEVEQTPEEKILEKYKLINGRDYALKDGLTPLNDYSFINGMIFVLETMNIKIKGIND